MTITPNPIAPAPPATPYTPLVAFEFSRDHLLLPLNQTADAGFTAIKNAYFNKMIIGLAVMDGGASGCGRRDGK